MKRSTERMLTTHVGSLARPQQLMDLSPPGITTDSHERLEVLRRSVADVVRKEADIGVDVISDGEHGKSNWQSYIMERMSGFEAEPVPPRLRAGHAHPTRSPDCDRVSHGVAFPISV